MLRGVFSTDSKIQTRTRGYCATDVTEDSVVETDLRDGDVLSMERFSAYEL